MSEHSGPISGWKDIRAAMLTLGVEVSERQLRTWANRPARGMLPLPVYAIPGSRHVQTTWQMLRLWNEASRVHVSARRKAAA